MSKQASELEKEAIKLNAKAKRLRHSNMHFDIMDHDLENWREKLQLSNDPEGAWKLVFFSFDYTGSFRSCRYSYGPSLYGTTPWSSEKWHKTFQNMGGAVIAHADTPQLLFPPPLSAKRLTIFGFLYVICPTELMLPDSTTGLSYSKFRPYVYGNMPCISVTSEKGVIPPKFGIACPDMSKPEDIDTIYVACTTAAKSNWNQPQLCMFDEEVQKLEQKKANLLAQKQEYETAWSIRDNAE